MGKIMLEERLYYEDEEIKITYYLDPKLFRKPGDKRIKNRIKVDESQFNYHEFTLIRGENYSEKNLEGFLTYFQDLEERETLDPKTFFEFTVQDILLIKKRDEKELDLADTRYMMRIKDLKKLCDEFGISKEKLKLKPYMPVHVYIAQNPSGGSYVLTGE